MRKTKTKMKGRRTADKMVMDSDHIARTGCCPDCGAVLVVSRIEEYGVVEYQRTCKACGYEAITSPDWFGDPE